MRLASSARIADGVGSSTNPHRNADAPFLCAVGLANIEIIEREGLVEDAARQGGYLKEALEAMKAKCEIVGDVRGLGLMLGIEIVADEASKTPLGRHAAAISQCRRDHGLLLGHRPTGAVSGNIIRTLPPSILRCDEADEALAILDAAIAWAQQDVEAPSASTSAWM